MSMKLEETTLLLPPTLAREIGIKPALLLQQLNYWIKNTKEMGCIYKGQRYIYNTYDDWASKLPSMSRSTVARAVSLLKKMEFIKVKRINDDQWDQTNWYTINYQKLEAFISSRVSKQDTQKSQTGTSKRTKLSRSSIDPKTTPKTTSKETTTPESAAVILKTEKEEQMAFTPVVETTQDILLCEPEIDSDSLDESETSSSDDSFRGVLSIVKKAGFALNEQFQWFLLQQHTEDVTCAIAFYQKTVQEKGERKNPIGWLISCLRGKWWLVEQLANKEQSFSRMPQEVNPPTIEQMAQLQSALDKGEIHDIHLSSDGVTKVIKLDRFTQVPWWVFLDLNHCARSSI